MTAKKALLLPPPPCATTCVATPSTSAAVATAPTMTYRLRMTPPSGRLGGDTQESWSGFRNRRACEHERTTALNGDRSGPRFACAAWAPRPRVSDPHGGTRRRHRRGRAGQDAQRDDPLCGPGPRWQRVHDLSRVDRRAGSAARGEAGADRI